MEDDKAFVHSPVTQVPEVQTGERSTKGKDFISTCGTVSSGYNDDDFVDPPVTQVEYEGFSLSHEIVNQKNEQYLIQLARDGLKEDICEGLESTEFATLGALFQEEAEVEEILEMDKTPEKSPRRRKRKTMRFGDPEDYYPWDKPGRRRGRE